MGLSLDSLHGHDWQGLRDLVGMTEGGTDDEIEDLILEIGERNGMMVLGGGGAMIPMLLKECKSFHKCTGRGPDDLAYPVEGGEKPLAL